MAALRPSEIVRKCIHLSSSLVPVLYWTTYARDTMLKTTIVLGLLFLVAEYLRLRVEWIKRIFWFIFGKALREHEQEEMTGATYVFVGAAITIAVFPRELAIPALFILTLADPMAAIVGIPLGRHPFFSKSLEGSAAFFIISMLILLYFHPLHWSLLILVALAGTIVEARPARIDDNILIPSMVAALLYLLGLVF